MEDFIKSHTTLPIEFINDFFMISKEEYNEKDKIINFDLVIKWLEVTKGNLKRLLVDNFVFTHIVSFELMRVRD